MSDEFAASPPFTPHSSLLTYYSLLSMNMRQKVGIALMRSLPSQKFVVAAARAVGILMADAGTCLIDRAAARFEIEEHADAVEDRVLLMSQHADASFHFREAAFGGFRIDPEVARESLN